ICRPRSTTLASRRKSPPSSHWRGISCICCGPGIRSAKMFVWENLESRRSARLAPRKDCLVALGLVAWAAGPAPSPDRQPMNDATFAESHSAGAPSRASGSSFYTAMRILPRAQREAMFEIYSFCRRVDDIADSTAPHAERRPLLTEWRNRIEGIYAGQPPSGLQGLAKAVAD